MDWQKADCNRQGNVLKNKLSAIFSFSAQELFHSNDSFQSCVPRAQSFDHRSLDLESHVNAFKSKIRNNEQEMNRQVFSLIMLRKFSPENSFQVNSETLGNSISEFISN